MVSFRTVTRQELYDLVWSRPMRDVAIEFGISDVGLGKTCARYGIPKPPRGYWARLQAGQKVEQQPLARPNEDQEIRIYSTTSHLPDAAREVLASAKEEKAAGNEGTDPPEPTAPFPVVDVHKSIKLTTLTLRKSKPANDGSVRAVDEGMHGIVVSKALVERAVFILDSLVRRFEREELTVTPSGKAVEVASGQDNISLTLLEATRREKHIPTAEELKEEEKKKKRFQNSWSGRRSWDHVDLGPYRRPYPDWDTLYTGDLVVQIEGYGGLGLRRRWADRKTRKLESLLDEVVVGVRAYIAAKRAQREHWEEQERQRQHLQRRQEKARLRRERETKRVAFLTSLTDQQREVSRLQEWLAAPPGQRDSANLERMNRWIRERLAVLQSALDPIGIEKSLEDQKLFPDADPLHDPEGEPPKDPYSYY